MKLSRRRLWIIGIAAFFVFAVARVPASLVGLFIADTPVTISGYSGTLWSGQARQFAAGGIDFGGVRWSWKPSGLLRARMEFDVESQGSGPRFDGVVGASIAGTVHARAFSLQVSLQQFGVQFNTAGDLAIGIDSLRLENQWPDEAAGSLILRQLTIDVPDLATQSVETMNFGDFEGEFTLEDNGPLSAQFRDRDGALEVNGTMTLDAVGNYSINGDLKPRGTLGNRLQNLLQFMPRSAQGTYALGFSGQL